MSSLHSRVGMMRVGKLLALSLKMDSPQKQLLFERAKLGAAELEKFRPGSIARLKIEDFNISCPQTCALAQTFGHYEKAPAHFLLNTISWGFGIDPREMHGNQRLVIQANVDLSNIWKDIVKIYRDMR